MALVMVVVGEKFQAPLERGSEVTGAQKWSELSTVPGAGQT